MAILTMRGGNQRGRTSHIRRVWTTRALAAAMFASSLLPLACRAASDSSWRVLIDVHVVDESGNPVAYATAWRSASFASTPEPHSPYQLTMPDLLRLAERYKGSFEIMQNHAEPLDRSTLFIRMSDASGWLHDVIAPDGDFIRRDALQTIDYAFLRRGFAVGHVSIVPAAQERYTVKVVMQRESGSVPNAEPEYLETFDRARFGLSDGHRNELMTRANHERLQKLRDDLAEAAGKAEQVDDHPSAALIYARMECLPNVVVDGGSNTVRITGYSHCDQGSDESKAVLSKAIRLDPDNGYLRFRALRNEGAALIAGFKLPMDAADEKRLADYVARMGKAIAEHGNHALPFDRLAYVYDLIRLQRFDDAEAEIRRLEAWEPAIAHECANVAKYLDYERRKRPQNGAIPTATN